MPNEKVNTYVVISETASVVQHVKAKSLYNASEKVTNYFDHSKGAYYIYMLREDRIFQRLAHAIHDMRIEKENITADLLLERANLAGNFKGEAIATLHAYYQKGVGYKYYNRTFENGIYELHYIQKATIKDLVSKTA